MKTLPDVLTIGDAYRSAMEMTEQADADEWFEALVERCMRSGNTLEEAEAIERSNLGYFAGYYTHETRLRVERLFRCAHPIFGPATAGPIEPRVAFEIGKRLAEENKAKTKPITKLW